MPGNRNQIANLAILQIGAHYVFGAYGNKPGVTRDEDPHCFPGPFGRRVQMMPNSQRTSTQAATVNAARTNVRTIRICPGRSSIVGNTPHANLQWPVPEPTAEERVNRLDLPQCTNLYPRPDNVPCARTIWGESCVGIRHFDCIGFVNWLVWRVSAVVVHHSVNHWKNPNVSGTRQITGFSVTDRSTYGLLRRGDILALNRGSHEHLGIVAGPNRVVHARSRYTGVRLTPFNAVAWDFAGILPRNILERANDR